MGVSDGASEGVLGSNGAVVGALGAGGDAALWPAERSALIKVEEGEFLFEAEPDFFVFLSFERFGRCGKNDRVYINISSDCDLSNES